MASPPDGEGEVSEAKQGALKTFETLHNN